MYLIKKIFKIHLQVLQKRKNFSSLYRVKPDDGTCKPPHLGKECVARQLKLSSMALPSTLADVISCGAPVTGRL